jgi:RND family efflux transporter MFP subunit
MKLKTTTINYFIPFLLLTAGCGEHKESAQAEMVIKVTTESVESYNGLITTSYSGVVEEKNNTPLSFFSAGTITEIRVKEGEQVRKGDLIARLDATSTSNAYKIALLQEQKAQDAYNRLKPMYENGSLPPIKFVEAETGLNQAIANTKIAKKNVEENNLYAASNGTIGKIHLTQGMNTGPGIPVLDLLEINTVYIKVPVPEDEISSLKQKTKASVTIPAISKKIIGEVKEISVTADLLSHSYPVKIEINNTDLFIKPGMVCYVTIDSESNKTGFLISGKALQKDINGDQFVYVVDDKNKAMKKLVKTISLMENKVLVEGEIKEGDLIIVSGQEKLKPQVSVNIIQ